MGVHFGRENQSISKNEHITALAKDLLDDIELGRLTLQAILLKTSRLARLTENEWWTKWLNYEMTGYDNSPGALEYMKRVGRLTDPARNLGYWGPLTEIEAISTTSTLQLQGLRITDVSVSLSSANPNEYLTKIHAPDPASVPAIAINSVIAQSNVLNEKVAS